jgi:hypothetical protein
LRLVAAFFPAATRFGDFRVVALRAVVRFRVVAAFLRAGAVLRLREVAAFFPAATRFGDFRVVLLRVAGLVDPVFLAADRFLVAAFVLAAVAALRAAVDRRVRVVTGSVAAPSIGPPRGAMVSDRGVGRSQAGVSGCQDGSGALGESRAPRSSAAFLCSEPSDTGSSASFPLGSHVVRSSDDGMNNLLRSRVSHVRTRTYSKRCTRKVRPRDVPGMAGIPETRRVCR